MEEWLERWNESDTAKKFGGEVTATPYGLVIKGITIRDDEGDEELVLSDVRINDSSVKPEFDKTQNTDRVDYFPVIFYHAETMNSWANYGVLEFKYFLELLNQMAP